MRHWSNSNWFITNLTTSKLTISSGLGVMDLWKIEFWIQQDLMCRPPDYSFIAETDASFFSSNNGAGGFIIKDQHGSLIAARLVARGMSLVLHAECAAILEGLRFALNGSFNNIWIRSNSLQAWWRFSTILRICLGISEISLVTVCWFLTKWTYPSVVLCFEGVIGRHMLLLPMLDWRISHANFVSAWSSLNIYYP